jgi:hypothetical protein
MGFYKQIARGRILTRDGFNGRVKKQRTEAFADEEAVFD